MGSSSDREQYNILLKITFSVLNTRCATFILMDCDLIDDDIMITQSVVQDISHSVTATRLTQEN